MLIDERIHELSEKGAKELLRRAVEEIAGRTDCGTCAMRLVCGQEATVDDCMRKVLTLLAVPEPEFIKEEADEERDDAGAIFYNPKTMRIV